jgi:hypothetical protein
LPRAAPGIESGLIKSDTYFRFGSPNYTTGSLLAVDTNKKIVGNAVGARDLKHRSRF